MAQMNVIGAAAVVAEAEVGGGRWVGETKTWILQWGYDTERRIGKCRRRGNFPIFVKSFFIFIGRSFQG